MPLIFIKSVITVIMKFTYNTGTSLTKLRLFFPEVFFIINTLFPPFRETLYHRRINSLLKRRSFSRMLYLSSSSAKPHTQSAPSGSQNWKSKVASSGPSGGYGRTNSERRLVLVNLQLAPSGRAKVPVQWNFLREMLQSIRSDIYGY
jgi:hypothetical protein